MKIFLTAVAVLALIGVSEQKCSEEFKKHFLAKHNELRAKHGAKPLQLSNEINDWAQQWADHLANTGSFQHRPNNKYGENLYMMGGSSTPHLNGDEPVDSWYSEIKDYHYSGREPDMSTFMRWGHYTQLVWKSSQKLGVGCGVSGNSFYVVGNYDPHGNVIGQFAQNVQ